MINLDKLLKEIQDTCEIVKEELEEYPGEDLGLSMVTCWVIKDERIQKQLMSIEINPIEGNFYSMYEVIGHISYIKRVFDNEVGLDFSDE